MNSNNDKQWVRARCECCLRDDAAWALSDVKYRMGGGKAFSRVRCSDCRVHCHKDARQPCRVAVPT